MFLKKRRAPLQRAAPEKTGDLVVVALLCLVGSDIHGHPLQSKKHRAKSKFRAKQDGAGDTVHSRAHTRPIAKDRAQHKQFTHCKCFQAWWLAQP